MNGCHIIDCFSTAKVSFDVANYVAVGSGIAGYAGGITSAAMDGIRVAEQIASQFAPLQR